MNIFKISYKVKRENSDEIYKGFGFKHLSDATQYYLHPNNQSFSGTTTLCQPIGEAITLFTSILSSILKGDKNNSDFYYIDNYDTVYIDIAVPDDWRSNGVIDEKIHRYRALLNNSNIKIGSYDYNDRWIDGNMDNLSTLYKLLPCFIVLLVRKMGTDSDFNNMLLNYVEVPAVDTFVNIHEDFYQAHKADDYELEYSDVSSVDKKELLSFSSSYKVIRYNRQMLQQDKEIDIIKFPQNEFRPDWLQFIPKLPKEFQLPKALLSVCNAVAQGDARAVLFHGPAGTGKTMSCKLICREIDLPLIDTINCTENLDEFVLGKYIPYEDKIIFKESYVTHAIREGGAVVFEEINFAKPQYLAFLNSLLDDNGFVRLDNGEVVKRHPNFRFFATMNLGYFGTKELNQALYNRFNCIVEIAALSDEAITKMLVTRVPECKGVVDKLLSVYHKLKRKIESEELDVVISPRNLENWARLAKYDGYVKAAEKTIIPIAKCDRVLEEAIRGIIFLYKWD